MGFGFRWAGLLAVAAGALSVGCNRSAVRRNDPPDPLLMSKTPVQSKYAEAQPVAVRTEPVPPPMPSGVWEPASVAGRATPDSHAFPATHTLHADRGGLMGRAVDYGWVEGVMERSAGGQWLLRYENLSRDQYGGKLLLARDPRLDQFHPGDVVRIEGDLVTEPIPASGRAWVPHPDYRIRSVRLIQAAR